MTPKKKPQTTAEDVAKLEAQLVAAKADESTGRTKLANLTAKVQDARREQREQREAAQQDGDAAVNVAPVAASSGVQVEQ